MGRLKGLLMWGLFGIAVVVHVMLVVDVAGTRSDEALLGSLSFLIFMCGVVAGIGVRRGNGRRVQKSAGGAMGQYGRLQREMRQGQDK